MVVVVPVNGILARAKDQATMERFVAELEREFMSKGMGDVKYYMGCRTKRNVQAREVQHDQHLYVKSMVETFGVDKARSIADSSEVPTLSNADELQTSEEKGDMSEFSYRKIVGALMWPAVMTRPDIACGVRTMARV